VQIRGRTRRAAVHPPAQHESQAQRAQPRPWVRPRGPAAARRACLPAGSAEGRALAGPTGRPAGNTSLPVPNPGAIPSFGRSSPRLHSRPAPAAARRRPAASASSARPPHLRAGVVPPLSPGRFGDPDGNGRNHPPGLGRTRPRLPHQTAHSPRTGLVRRAHRQRRRRSSLRENDQRTLPLHADVTENSPHEPPVLD
jgi:hypothetical protein